MKMNVTFNYTTVCKTVLQEQLDALCIDYTIKNLGEIEFKKKLSASEQNHIANALGKYGIEILADPKNILVQRIKEAITEFINDSEKTKKYTVSNYLAETLNYSYAHLSSLFSEITHSSIENFIILKKIDTAKHLIINKNLTLTEIAFHLNYSSVAHLSSQFKKTTGLTPSTFQRIIKRRKENNIMITK